MNFLIVFTLDLVTASAFSLGGNQIKSRTGFAPISVTEGRITNGQDAKEYQFRYQVRLSSKINATAAFLCGGSLIGNKCHYTKGVQSVTVYLGSIRRTSAEVKYTVSGSAIINHSGYNADTVKHDISFIEIPYTVFTARIQHVKLPAITLHMSDNIVLLLPVGVILLTNPQLFPLYYNGPVSGLLPMTTVRNPT